MEAVEVKCVWQHQNNGASTSKAATSLLVIFISEQSRLGECGGGGAIGVGLWRRQKHLKL